MELILKALIRQIQMSTGTGTDPVVFGAIQAGSVSTSVTLSGIVATSSGILPSGAYMQLSLSALMLFPSSNSLQYTTTLNSSTGVYSFTAVNTPIINNSTYIQAEMDAMISPLALPAVSLTGNSTLIKLGMSGAYTANNMEGNYTAYSFGSFGRSLHTDAFSTDASWNTLVSAQAWDNSNAWIYVSTQQSRVDPAYDAPFVSLYMPSATWIDKVEIQAQTVGFVRGPRDFKVFGSNLQGSWTEVYATTGVSWPNALTTSSFSFPVRSNAYKSYALVVRTIDGDASNSRRYLSMSNVKFYTTLTPGFSPNVTGIPAIANTSNGLSLSVSPHAPSLVAKTLILSPSAVLESAMPTQVSQHGTLGRVLLTAAAMAICGPTSYSSKLTSIMTGESNSAVTSSINGNLVTVIKNMFDDLATKQAIVDYVRSVAGDFLSENPGNNNLSLDMTFIPTFALQTSLGLTLQYSRFNQNKVLRITVPLIIKIE